MEKIKEKIKMDDLVISERLFAVLEVCDLMNKKGLLSDDNFNDIDRMIKSSVEKLVLGGVSNDELYLIDCVNDLQELKNYISEIIVIDETIDVIDDCLIIINSRLNEKKYN